MYGSEYVQCPLCERAYMKYIAGRPIPEDIQGMIEEKERKKKAVEAERIEKERAKRRARLDRNNKLAKARRKRKSKRDLT